MIRLNTIIHIFQSGNWSRNSAEKVIWGADDDFIEQLKGFKNIQTLVLPWMRNRLSNWSSLQDKSNLLTQEYYEWTASDPLCTWVETPGTIRMRYDVIHNRTCNRKINRTLRPRSLKPLYFNAKPLSKEYYWPKNLLLPPYFYKNPPPFVFYVHIITNAIVTGVGDVYFENAKLVPYGCKPNGDPRLPGNPLDQPLYEELFVITQYWGTSVFHRMLEIAPRLGSSLHFLKQNPHIQILTPEGPNGTLGELFQILGLNPNRMVTKWGRAKIVYLPRASMCGYASVQETQIISNLYQRYIVEHVGKIPRNKLILIRRSKRRRFTEQTAIEKVVEQAAREYNLDYVMFIDNPVPSLRDTMRLFHAAVMIVAPHGAGLSNVIFSQPGTYVIEGVCNLPHLNFCFQRTSVMLGHHWHGIPSRGGCEGVIDVAASSINDTVREYLTQRKNFELGTVTL